MSNVKESAKRIVEQWDNHDRFRDFDKTGEPDDVAIARAYLDLLAGAWCVRELEWRECNAWHWRADGPFVVIDLYLTIDGGYWWSGGCGCSSTKEFPSLDAAKAAAQAWFNEKMTAGLRRVGEQLTLTKESLR